MENDYDLMIIGSTFAGMGAAYASTGRMLVLESSPQVGYEFINSFNPGKDWNKTELSGVSAALKKELLEREILLENGSVHLPAIAPFLYDRIKKDNIPVLLMTDLVNVQIKENGFEVEAYNASGFIKFKTSRILDTTFNTRIQHTCKPEILSKSINAILYNPEEDPTELFMWDETAQLVRGKFPGEVILKLKIRNDADWVSARHQMHKFWAGRPDRIRSWVIAAVADYFEMNMKTGPESVGINWNILPSCAYHNPLEAFEMGFQFIKKEDE